MENLGVLAELIFSQLTMGHPSLCRAVSLIFYERTSSRARNQMHLVNLAAAPCLDSSFNTADLRIQPVNLVLALALAQQRFHRT